MPLVDGLAGQMVENHRRAGQVVEQRVEALEIERQPMLHAGEAPPFADRGVEAVVARRRAERLDVVAAEAADRLGRQRHLGHRLQRDLVARAGGALRGDVEGADRLQRVAEEIEPHRFGGAGRVEIEDAAAHGELADIAHRRHALEAGGFQPRDQRVHVDVVAGSCAETLRLDHLGRRNALEERIGGGEDDGAVRVLLQRDHGRQRVQPARRGVGAGRHAVVGQAIPGREFQHRQVGRCEGERLDDRGQPLPVARDEQDRAVGGGFSRDSGEREGFKAVGHAVDDELAGPVFRQADGIDKAHGFIFRSSRPALPQFSPARSCRGFWEWAALR